MIKAVFVDYTGTTVQEGGREMEEVVRRLCQNSAQHDPRSVIALWWKLVKQYEADSYADSYITEDEIVDRLLSDLEKQIQLKDDTEALHELIRGFWVHAPLFPDAKPFYEGCPAPLYVISNNGIEYITRAMEEKGLSPAGIVCADMVRAYKPHKELFEKALEISGCRAEEVVHIGDSYSSDVQGAIAAGITPILLRRNGDHPYEGITTVRSLTEVLPLLAEKGLRM